MKKGAPPPFVTRPQSDWKKKPPRGTPLPVKVDTQEVPPYLTRDEKVIFDSMYEAGKYSRFRVKSCANCRTRIPDGREFCSFQCFKEKQ